MVLIGQDYNPSVVSGPGPPSDAKQSPLGSAGAEASTSRGGDRVEEAGQFVRRSDCWSSRREAVKSGAASGARVVPTAAGVDGQGASRYTASVVDGKSFV